MNDLGINMISCKHNQTVKNSLLMSSRKLYRKQVVSSAKTGSYHRLVMILYNQIYKAFRASTKNPTL